MVRPHSKRFLTTPWLNALALSAVLGMTALSIAAGDWERVDAGTLAWLKAVHFVDADHGWIAGGSGTFLKTTDGGKTWQREKVTRDNIRDVVFTDRENGWLLCEQSIFGPGIESPTYILRTQNGGSTWEKVSIEPGRERMLRLVLSPTANVAYAIGETGTMLFTNSLEDTWKRTALATQTMLTDGKILNDKEAILVGGRGTILRTDNGGITWTEVKAHDNEPPRKLNAVYFIDDKKGWAVGAEGKILITENGGNTWFPEASGVTTDLLDVIFLDNAVGDNAAGFAVGDAGTIIQTKDSGKTWIKMDSGTKHRLERIVRSGNKLIAAGFGGTVLIKQFRK